MPSDFDLQFWRYCVEPDALVLTSDFRWIPLEDISIGQDIITVTEKAGIQSRGEGARRWTVAKVLNKRTAIKPCLKFILDEGPPIITTLDHRLLTYGNGHHWTKAEDTRCDGAFNSRLTLAVRYTDHTNLDEAWLGGFMDGEGSISGTKLGVGKQNAQYGWGYMELAQNPGAAFNRACQILTKGGFEYAVRQRPEDGCMTLRLLGSVRETLAALVEFRPIRLHQNMLKIIGSNALRATKFEHPRIVEKQEIGDHPVIDIETTSGTFLANGYVVHNCGKDSAVTFEINQVQEGKLKPKQREHYQFNLNLLAPLLYMELRGIRYDHEKAKQKLSRVQKGIATLQDLINRADGKSTLSIESRSYLDAIKAKCCISNPRRVKVWQEEKVYKNGKRRMVTRRESKTVAIESIQDCFEFARSGQHDTLRSVQKLLGKDHLRPRDRGELSVLLGMHVKVNATGAGKDAQVFLYETLGFPKQFKKEGNKLTDKLATDDEAIIKILVSENKKPQPFSGAVRLKNRGRIALAFLRLRRLLTESKTLRAGCDFDGRIRCGYNLIKSSGSGGPTKTGRLACYESPTGSGFNLQTVTKKHRDLFLADEGCLMAQMDLSGADGWTVAAYSAMLGDPTMLEDYKAGLKPAKIGVLMWKEGPGINQLSRQELKEKCKAVDPDAWEYFGFKRVQHGSSYMMGERTMSNQILTDSWKLTGKPVVVPENVCKQMQMTCFFARYRGIPMWHRWMAQELREKGSLTASNGFTRKFFGRKDDHATIKEALAHLPQVYTTAVTEMALLRIWGDPDNRNGDCFIVEPLHTVHDSALMGFEVKSKEFYDNKIKEWFNNPIQIANELIVIPAEGGTGYDWKNLAN